MTAFMSKPGFKPVKHLTGAPYNGQANMYQVIGATSLVPGDVVTLDGTGHSSGVPTCTISTAAAIPCGVVVGIVNTKLDPVTGKMTTGSISLDTPQTAAAGQFVMVADAPDLVCETEIATYVQANVNTNLELVPTSYNTSTGGSNMTVITNTDAATDPFKLMGTVQRDDYVSGATYARAADADTNVKVLVMFNTHAYKATTGTAAV